MEAVLHREFVYLWYYVAVQADQILSYWILGIVIGSAVSVFGRARIHRLFGRMQGEQLGLFGLLPAGVLGILSPLCMYGTIPIAASFAARGMREDWLAAFMMSSVLLNPQLLLYSAVLGTPLLLVRFVSCLLCGIAAGYLVNRFYTRRGRRFFLFDGFTEPENHDTDPNRLRRFLKMSAATCAPPAVISCWASCWQHFFSAMCRQRRLQDSSAGKMKGSGFFWLQLPVCRFTYAAEGLYRFCRRGF